MKRIIHKSLLIYNEGILSPEESNLKYLCNRKIKAGRWLITEITNKKVTCKNCLKILNNKDLYNKIMTIERL